MTMMMQWLRPKQNPNKVRFIAMMESGVLIDEIADVVQTQVIAQKAKASIRNRDAVPIYHQLEEDAPPVWKENAIVESGLANPPGTESRHVIDDSHNLWMGYQTGTVDSGGWNLEARHLGIIALGVSVLIFMIFGWLTSMNLSDPVEATNDSNGSGSKSGVGAEENSHGFVAPAPQSEEGVEEGTDARPAGAGGTPVPDGAGPPGTGPADPVVGPGDGGDSPGP